MTGCYICFFLFFNDPSHYDTPLAQQKCHLRCSYLFAHVLLLDDDIAEVHPFTNDVQSNETKNQSI